MKKAIINIMYIISLVLILWIVLSFIDINIHNKGGKADYDYASWNVFSMMM